MADVVADGPAAPARRVRSSAARAALELASFVVLGAVAAAEGGASTTSATTTVTLSLPPWSSAAATSAWAASEGSSYSVRISGDLVVAALVGQPVAAEQQAAAGLEVEQPGVDLDPRVDAERAGEDVPVRVDRGLIGRELTVADHLLDEAVVLGEAG